MSGKNNRKIGSILHKREMLILVPQAPGSSPISGLLIFCNPNPFHSPNPFPPLVLAVYCPRGDIMSPKSEQRSLPIASCIHAFLAILNLTIIVEVCLFSQPATLRMKVEEVAL